MSINGKLAEVTRRIVGRSEAGRARYLDLIERMASRAPQRRQLGCANLAHGFAACGVDKPDLRTGTGANLGIVTAFNDMLSAHQPFEDFPRIIKEAARSAGGTAQVAGGVAAMCDGVTQGQAGMELSLFSRDVIALSTAVALSHQMFDAAMCLGVCDKIVPGLVIGALSFGHLPVVFAPAGPMTSGLPNDEKAKVRQLFAEGKVDRSVLLETEARSYHGPGTCTFYGTANTNQVLMEIMGLHVPGASFVNPHTPLRDALTRRATARALEITALGNEYIPMGRMLDERSFANAIVGLLATGGSTNHTIHLVAMAAAAGITLTWEDMDDLAQVTPLLCRIYPNGKADVNHFQAAGGTGFLIRELLEAGLLHPDVMTIWGQGLDAYASDIGLEGETLVWRQPPTQSSDRNVVRGAAEPFDSTGGLRLLTGNLGRAIMKTSSIPADRHVVEAPAMVFNDQEEVHAAFAAGRLYKDVVVVVRYQGPMCNGMPELHRLMPPLGVLQDRGFRVALVTDGRLSGASGKVPAAIHVTPEALAQGPLAKVRDGDLIRVDALSGTLSISAGEAEIAERPVVVPDLEANNDGVGRNLFASFRQHVGHADQGAAIFGRSFP